MARPKDYGLARGWPVGSGSAPGSVLSISGSPPAAVVGLPYSFTFTVLSNGQNVRSTFPVTAPGADGRTLAQRGFAYDGATHTLSAAKVLA